MIIQEKEAKLVLKPKVVQFTIKIKNHLRDSCDYISTRFLPFYNSPSGTQSAIAA